MPDASEIDPLRAELTDANASLRLTAAETLMTTPELARWLAPELLQISATSDDALREVVMGAIEAMGPPEASRAPGRGTKQRRWSGR